MIDYFKINDLQKGMAIQELLDFEIKVNDKTGELLQNRKKSAHLRNLVFTITPGNNPKAKVQGSLHKFYNQGLLNNDTFTIEKFNKVAEDLEPYISPGDKINVLEFGINIETPFLPSLFIENLIASGKRQFNKIQNPGINFSEAVYNQYYLKIYDKGTHQGPPDKNILRIEAKYRKMENLFKNGLTWSNLGNPLTWEYLAKVLKQKFNEVIYWDPSINIYEVKEPDRSILERGHNPIFWINLSGPHVSRERKKFQLLIIKHGSIFKDLPQLFEMELAGLVNSDHYFRHKKDSSLSTNYENVVNSVPLLYSHYSPPMIDGNVCPVTGISITMQKTSKFLSISGIKYLYLNDRKKFDELKKARLSKKWMTYPVEVWFREIAHSVRNEYFNPKHNTLNAIKKINKDPALFEIMPMISEEKKVRAGI